MLFSSIPFLYYFLPAVLLLYFMAPRNLKNYVLLFGSLFFYAWGGVSYALLMISSILLGYIFALFIDKSKSIRLRKTYLTIYLIAALGLLGYYKYADFFITNINEITQKDIPLLKVILPIGISFYTFQILSYVVDVYRKDVTAQKNPFILATYISMFSQLIAGPIVRYVDVAEQLENRTHTLDKTIVGIRRFVLGFSKKILIANALGKLCDIFQLSQDKSILFYWMYAVAFMLHIYYDFSGYSDMAIGIGKILGFDFLENFNYPYISKSITEFWRRWHMSLGSWFRDYVYIPLGGNRVKKSRLLLNIFIVWFLTGFWHGASWNFIIWGLYFAVILVLEKFWLQTYLKKTGFFQHIYVLVLVCISFVIFNATNMTDAIVCIGAMFGAGEVPSISAEAIYYFRSYFVIYIMAMIGATPMLKTTLNRLRNHSGIAKCLDVIEPIVMVALLIVCTAYLVDGSFNPFLYFRF